MKKFVLVVCALLFFSTLKLYANKTGVEIKAPNEIAKGSEVTLVLNVLHKGNSKMHHTNWVYLKINGKEVKRWLYDKTHLPQDQNFTVDYKLTASEDMTIEAEGHCILHGSKGISKISIKIK